MRIVEQSRTILLAEDLGIAENIDLRTLVGFIDSLTFIDLREDCVGFVKDFISLQKKSQLALKKATSNKQG